MAKQKVILLRGLPASGKTTWALNKVKEDSSFVRVNKDDLRDMFNGGKYSKALEKQVVEAEKQIVWNLLKDNISVIVDNTNLNEHHEITYREIVRSFTKTNHKIEFIVNDSFLEVGVEECILRDSQRARPVGEDVIRSMAKQAEKFIVYPYVPNKRNPRAIICDLDGTLALMNGRNPFDPSTCDQDLVNEPVLEVLKRFRDSGVILIFLSGREDAYRNQTLSFLRDKCKIYTNYYMTPLYMRKNKDHRKDYIVKQELFDKYIRDDYNVLFCLDDRNQVVDMWRKKLKLPCFQVNYGDF